MCRRLRLIPLRGVVGEEDESRFIRLQVEIDRRGILYRRDASGEWVPPLSMFCSVTKCRLNVLRSIAGVDHEIQIAARKFAVDKSDSWSLGRKHNIRSEQSWEQSPELGLTGNKMPYRVARMEQTLGDLANLPTFRFCLKQTGCRGGQAVRGNHNPPAPGTVLNSLLGRGRKPMNAGQTQDVLHNAYGIDGLPVATYQRIE